MTYFAVAVGLFVWGCLVGRSGQKLGTVLAAIPVLVWFAMLAWSVQSGVLDTRAEDELLASMMIGLLAFLTGSNLADRSACSRTSYRE